MAYRCRKHRHQQQIFYVENKQINTTMQEQHQSAEHKEKTCKVAEISDRDLGDISGINISGYIKVFDPNTQEVIVEARE